MKRWTRFSWALAYGFLLTAFTAYVLWDTFVIVRIYARLPSESAVSASDTPPAAQTLDAVTSTPVPLISDNLYRDEHISIVLTEYRVADTTVYAADILLSDPSYLQSAFAHQSYGRNVTAATSTIAQEAQAILAINGDYYGSRPSGYVIRNGVLYRETATAGQVDLVIYADGTFELIQEDRVSASELMDAGAAQVYAFGPALVAQGQVVVASGDEVDKAMNSNPRTAIGILEPCHYLFVVSDGRTDESAGLSLAALGEFMASLGAVTAYNLDGGGSSTMVFLGQVVNQPTTNGKRIQERSVSDIVFIGY